jgi:myo-inositol-1(or 4)-monophosphatase
MPTQQEITGSHALIVDTFRGFRSELMQAYGNIDFSAKGDASPVTLLDIKIEIALKDKLLTQFPVFGFKGEETEEVVGPHNATWYVDPIDSTSSFVHGLPYCSNMAGLVVDGEIVASIIYHFVTDELFTAFKGEGAYRNGEQISVCNTDLNNSYVFADAYSYINVYDFYAPNGVKFYAPVGATGYFLTRVAQGNVQGACYLSAKIKQHDVIPGALLVAEAGGGTVSLTGQPFDYTCLRFMMGTKNICDLTTQQLDKIIAVREGLEA